MTTFGSVTGGTGTGSGVHFAGNGNNLLTNYGSIAALSGLAVVGDDGSETIENFGTITGSVDLDQNNNSFNNRAGGVVNSGDMVLLNGGTLTNAGTLAPHGVGTVGTTSIESNLVQTSTGILAIDLDAAAGNVSDLVIVSNTAVLGGSVAAHVISLPAATAQTFTIMQAAGPVTNQGATLSASPALNATLSFPSNMVQISTSVDFSVSGLNRNQRAIADNLEEAFGVGGGGVTPVLLGLLNTPGLDAYKNALDQLSPEVMSDAQISALYASLGFANSLLSCKVNGTTTASIIEEGQCLWAGANARFLDSGSTFDLIGFNQSTGLFAAGAQVALANAWRLGFGAGYQKSTLETATNASTEGQMAQAGIALKYNPGPWLLAGVVSGGHGWYDTSRPMAFGGFSGTATSNSGIDILNGGLRAAYVFGSPELYFKPMVDAAATRLDLGGLTETGGGAASLSVQGTQQTVYTIAPSLEVGTEWWWPNGTLIRPFLRAGATWYSNSDFGLSAAFLAAPAGVTPFTIHTSIDEVMGVVGAGLDVINGNDAVLHLAYDGQLGETTQIHAIGLKGSARF